MTPQKPTKTFQSTPPCGGDLICFSCWRLTPDFNPRPLAGATPRLVITPSSSRDFNPRPLAGATLRFRRAWEVRYISIHAPLRGRQIQGSGLEKAERFQSTPPCGGDRSFIISSSNPPYFNPRPLAGATKQRRVLVRARYISIHAPLRGRPSWRRNISKRPKFQSTPPCGGDPPAPMFPLSPSRFQSTPPCGGDQRNSRRNPLNRKFQSTPPCGGDASAMPMIRAQFLFQSTPPCGGDPGQHPSLHRSYDFNPRPLAGATYGKCFCSLKHLISIHAPLRGRP